MKRLGCTATMHLNEKRTEVLDGFPSSCHVGHGVDYGECNSLILKRRFKENSLSSDAMPEKVLITTVKQSQDLLNEACYAKLPQKESIRRAIRRQQASIHPRPPQTLQELKDIPQRYQYIADQLFLQKDVTTAAGTRILIFGTTCSLQVLGIGSAWLFDGTFKVVPQIFTQLYTIHSYVDGAWTPGVYALLSSKQKEAYIELLSEVVRLICSETNMQPNPTFLLSDFELGFMKAAAEVFPSAEVRGCLFHFGQMIWRRAQKAGLQASLNQPNSTNLRTDLHCIIALAFVPVNDIKTTFDDLVDKIDSKLDSVVAHIHEYYVHGKTVGRKHLDPMFPPEVWNCHERVLKELPRTTNLLEGFHNKLNRLCEASHLNLFSFISKLHDIEIDATFDRTLALSGLPTKTKSTKQKKLDQRIKNKVSLYFDVKAQGRQMMYLKSLGFMFMGSAFSSTSHQPITTEQQGEVSSSSVSQSKSSKDEEDLNLLSTSQSIQTRNATSTDNKDPVVLLSQKTNVITWVFDPPTKSWQEERCSNNHLEFVSSLAYFSRGNTINQFTVPSQQYIVDVIGDGNCLFRCLSLVCSGSEKNHSLVRKHICEHMRQINYVASGKSPSEYLKTTKMEEDRVWGTTDELLVASSWLKTPIFVWCQFGKVFCWHCHDVLNLGRGTNNAIYLNNSSGNHFQVVAGI